MNREFSFRLYLPQGWAGCKILKQEWEGSAGHGGVIARGPEILVRHPLWTTDSPREDLTIMVFTNREWRDVEQERVIVSAAPFLPQELGRNRKFVFALPPRWYADELDGWQEVQKMIDGHPLQAF